jgi:hypothetical protein
MDDALPRRSTLEELRAWDTASQLKTSMQLKKDEGAGLSAQYSEPSLAAGNRPRTAVPRNRSGAASGAAARPASAAPAFARSAPEAEEGEEGLDARGEAAAGSSSAALALFDDQKLGAVQARRRGI